MLKISKQTIARLLPAPRAGIAAGTLKLPPLDPGRRFITSSDILTKAKTPRIRKLVARAKDTSERPTVLIIMAEVTRVVANTGVRKVECSLEKLLCSQPWTDKP